MSSSITLRGVQLLPLWRRRIPKYPIYWKGDPQLRVFLPQFWMKMIKPAYEVPKNHVHFEVHPQMSEIDVKNYLEKIYKVPVMDVRTETERGEDIRHPKKGFIMAKEEDKRLAFVVMAKSVEFEFPDIFEGKKPQLDKDVSQVNEMEKVETEESRKSWDRAAIPPWFR